MKTEQPALFDINQYQEKRLNYAGDWQGDVAGDDPTWEKPKQEFSVGDLVCEACASPCGDRLVKRHRGEVFKITSFSKSGWVHLEAINGELKTMLPLSDLRPAEVDDLSYVTAESLDKSTVEQKVLHKTSPEKKDLSYVTNSGVDDPKMLHKTSTFELPQLSYVTNSGVDDPKVLHKTSTFELLQLSYVTPESIDTSSVEPNLLHKTPPEKKDLSYVTNSGVDDPKVLHKTSTFELLQLSYVTPESIDTSDVEQNMLHKTLSRVKSDCLELSHQERSLLRDWLSEIIASEEAENFDAPVKSNREVVEVQREGATVYQLEKVKCGKSRCKSCPHGPY